MKQQTIYMDMDGVLVDFMGGAERVLGHAFDSSVIDAVNQEDRAEIVKLKEKFWTDLSPTPEMRPLWKIVSKYSAHILSAKANWDLEAKVNHSRTGKLLWIKKHLGIPLARVHIVNRADKQLYAQSESGPNILVDDHKKNIAEFERAGGIGIHHTSMRETVNRLRALGYQ